MNFYNIPKMEKKETPYPQRKASIAILYQGLDYTKPAINALAKKPYFTKAESRYKADYSLVIDASQEEDYGPATDGLVPGLLCFYLFPCRAADDKTLIKVVIVDNKNGKATSLGETTVVRSSYYGLSVLIFGPLFTKGNYMESKESSEDFPRYVPLFENFLARAADQAYDTKSELHTGEQYINDTYYAASLTKKKDPTAQDLLIFAQYGSSFTDFSTIKKRVKENVDQCDLSLALIKNENRMLPKEGDMYWQVLKYYKNSCASFRAGLAGYIGISTEQLAQKEGNPTSIFAINNLTQTISYKKSILKGEEVYTSETIYTVDNNIVTNVTTK